MSRLHGNQLEGEMRGSLFVACICLLGAACAASGVQVKEEQLAQFEVGKATTADVVTALGQPNQNILMPDGSRMLLYSYAEVQTRPETFIPIAGAFVGGANIRTNSVMLRFAPSGVLLTKSASSGSTETGMGMASGATVPNRVEDQPRQAPSNDPTQ
jgi:hypothetical protein